MARLGLQELVDFKDFRVGRDLLVLLVTKGTKVGREILDPLDLLVALKVNMDLLGFKVIKVGKV